MSELPSPLSPEEIVARLEGVSSDHGGDTPDYKFIEPTATAFDSFVDYVRNDEGRFLLGYPEVDLNMRGLARGEMLLVVGHSHNGKSQVLYQAIVNALLNSDAHILMFSPDEPRELVARSCIALPTVATAKSWSSRSRTATKPCWKRFVRLHATCLIGY